MGGSYGGYMTMAAITEHPELWSCAVNIVGIVNFVTFLERTGAYRRALREAEYGSLERDRAFLESISPIRKIDRIACPLMVIHGANDPRVPVSEAEQVVEALRARDAPVEYLRYEDEGHGITRLPNRLDCYPRVAAFLQQHLLPRRVTCNAFRMVLEADLEAARARIADAVVRTPVWRSDELDEALGCAVWLKCEPLQRTGSFKLRGATNAIRSLPAGTRGVVAVSSGNHAQAVAYAGRAAGLPVTVVMNADANAAKVRGDARLRRHGRLRGRRSDESRGDRARPRRARGPGVRAPVRRLERDRRSGHGHARAARGGARARCRDHAGRRRRAALGRGAGLPARGSPGRAPTAPSRRPRPTRSARSPRAGACASTTRR